MQLGGGRNPAASTPTVSPSSSSSGASAPTNTNLGFESMQKLQLQQLAFRQSLQQQQLQQHQLFQPQQLVRKGEGEDALFASQYGVTGGFMPQIQGNSSRLQDDARRQEENHNGGQFMGQNLESPALHAHPQISFQDIQQKSHSNPLIQQQCMISPVQPPQASAHNAARNQLGLAQLQDFRAWAQENNIDLSNPDNANMMNDLLQMWQTARIVAVGKQNETGMGLHNSCLPPTRQLFMSSPAGSQNFAQGSSVSDISGQFGLLKGQQGPLPSVGTATGANSDILQMQWHSGAHSLENHNEKCSRPPMRGGNGVPMMQILQTSSVGKSIEQLKPRNTCTGPDPLQLQNFRPSQQFNRAVANPAISSSEGVGGLLPSHGGSTHMPQQHIGFTKQQQHVLKAQILAFRRLKRGERVLPQEVLQAIIPPPLDLQTQQRTLSLTVNQERPAPNKIDLHEDYVVTNEKPLQLFSSTAGYNLPKVGSVSGEGKVVHNTAIFPEEHRTAPFVGNSEHDNINNVKAEHIEIGYHDLSSKGDWDGDKGKFIPMNCRTGESRQLKKVSASSNALQGDITPTKYHGPLFDFPSFSRKHDSFGSTSINYWGDLTLAYDIKNLFYEEGIHVLNKKRTEDSKRINGLLAVNLERKRIRPDLVVRLQIEEKKLRLVDFQSRLRDEVDHEQQEIMAMSDRPYRKFVRQCDQQRAELLRQVQHSLKASRDKQLKSIFQWRKKLLEAHWTLRDARTARNKGVAKYHERMLKEFSKKKDGDRNKRMEALKNNDMDRYREMLLEQQATVPGDASQRYAVLSSFLSQTEEYLLKLGGKITAAKNSQEEEEAATSAARAARSQGLSEEEVKAAAACAREEVIIRNQFSEINAPKGSSSVNKYYNLAHAVNERVIRQPSMLRAGTLRDYQLVGLQWMLSLYNNKLNGILADEMGLGKTVQVMALIAYLMEFKGNYGPHLIIVPNAVLVNWKSELHNWLPSVKCIFYVGTKEQRAKLFSHEVASMKFNVLVTTYEFIMYDRTKLSKVNWKYIIIDEAQRMKDRESVLARDLDRYQCQRRLLLTGTPLQNELKELWSLLNLLLPEIFDNRKAFHDWFAQPFQRDGPSQSSEEDDWLETEKKVIIIHRLHQILEPFMLRRRVEEVEGSLPPKVPIVLRCRMSGMQGAMYDWIKSTGTVRVDPDDEMRRAAKNPMYQVKMYKNLKNKCMELRKVCNHPLLTYPYFNDYSKEFIVRSCGKLWVLDRILIKLHRTGHRVLLFSTMTKLLDLLEEYLQWRRFVYRRIDGSTSLEDRESAIVDFNSPGSDCFIFLLSIRAAGRGLNLQTADTVVIYDPDANPQNEEQAVARAHRIGQTREVKVIYLEAVIDKISSFQKEDELRSGGTGGDLEDDLVGKDRYMGSIESLIRSNIQQYKIDMADEVINAGRFDQRTTHEERRMTLESLLHDEERSQETLHDVPSAQEVNRMIARSEEEVELFDQMDEELDWIPEMVKYNQISKWLRASTREVDSVVSSLSKKSSKSILAAQTSLDACEMFSSLSSTKNERRGRLRGSSSREKCPIYRELDDEDGKDSNASSEEGDADPSHDEEEEQGDHEGRRNIHMSAEVGSVGSSGSLKLPEEAIPSMSSQKFGSLSALDGRSGYLSRRTPEEVEEGEIALSGFSQVEIPKSGSWIHDLDNGETHVLQPKLKRKRSIRGRSKFTAETTEEKSSTSGRNFSEHRFPMFFQDDHNNGVQLRINKEIGYSESISEENDKNAASLNQKRNIPSRKKLPVSTQKSGLMSWLSSSAEETSDPLNWSAKSTNNDGQILLGTKPTDNVKRKCKHVTSRFRRRIDIDGHQVAPILFDLWKRNRNSSFFGNGAGASNLLDLQTIEQRVDSSEYNSLMDFIVDVQLMLKNVVQYSSYSLEVRKEAGRLQDIFFDIMKIAFPQADFQEARTAVTFSAPGVKHAASISGSSSRQAAFNQSKSVKEAKGIETDLSLSKSVANEPIPLERRRMGICGSKTQNESRPSISSHSQPEITPIAHPGELVICRNKRKDRDKQRVLTPPPSSKLSGLVGGFSSDLLDLQWAKRARTDTGKRRPSHL